ncbi:MAG TPA: ABC transporter substrate-binding protein [Candidatus Korarchaeota archaeon]|nr:ABC transporter substrate-binding protein [Candidatus Korarchaeota archaeon]
MDKKIVGAVLLVLLILGGIGFFLMRKEGPQPSPTPTTGPGPTEGIVLKIITRHASTIWKITKETFLNSDLAKQYNIVDLRFYSPNFALWPDVIKKEKPDVAWGGGPTVFNDLVEKGLVAPLTDPELLDEISSIPDDISGAEMKHYKDGKLMWVAAAISSFGFTYNKKMLNERGFPEPQTWEDLSSPVYGKMLPLPAISYARSTTSTSHSRIYQIILQKEGWEKGWVLIAGLAANGRPYGGSVEAQWAVQTGEVPIGIMIDFYGYELQLQSPDFIYVMPPGTIVNGDPIALLSTSSHPEAAQAFIRWVLSAEGQAVLWLDERINRMPVREDAFRTPKGRERMDLYERYNQTIALQAIQFNESLAGATYFSIAYYLDAVFCDTHDELVRTWKKLVDALYANKITQEEFERFKYELGKPLTWEKDGKTYTFTLEYAIEINEELKKNPAFASEMQSIWRQVAVQRYEGIYAQIPDP